LTSHEKVQLDGLLQQYPGLQDLYVWSVLIWLELRTHQPLSQKACTKICTQVQEGPCQETVAAADIKAIEQEAQRRLEAFLAEQARLAGTCEPQPRTIELQSIAIGVAGIVRRVCRAAVRTAIAAAIGLILLALVAYLRTGPILATVTQSLGAELVGIKHDPIHLRPGRYAMKAGLARIALGDGVEACIEGPAQFGVRSQGRMQLQSGRLFVKVRLDGLGFTVDTPHASIVDLGTSFGLYVQSGQHSDLHMFSGMAKVMPGGQEGNVLICAGQANRISSHGRIEPIGLDEYAFARRFYAATGMVWRGQPLDLADIIGGGNGLGNGLLGQWIDVGSGSLGTTYIIAGRQTRLRNVTDHRYHPVKGLAYVDGVFSPDGSNGPIKISSEGHMWQTCPKTCGLYFEDIYNGDYIEVGMYSHRLILANTVYGTRTYPGIAVHSNTGITFDMQAIRKDVPGLQISCFRAICGISEDAARYASEVPQIQADLWVLVDGQVRFSATVSVRSGPAEVCVEIGPDERFLTLACTDSDGIANYDWAVFGVPRLEVFEAN
jgi:ferric-dicitrate binding protein FerR (iron transport regulator)